MKSRDLSELELNDWGVYGGLDGGETETEVGVKRKFKGCKFIYSSNGSAFSSERFYRRCV